MAFAFLRSAHGGTPDGSAAAVATFSSVGASALFAFVGAYGAPTLQDNLGNIWQSLATGGSQSGGMTLFGLPNPITGVTHVVTAAALANSYQALVVLAYTQIGHGFTLGETNAGSVTPIQDGAMVLQGLTQTGAGTAATVSGGTLRDQQLWDGNAIGRAVADFIQTTATVSNPQWTYGGSGGARAQFVIYETPAPGSGLGGYATRYRRRHRVTDVTR